MAGVPQGFDEGLPVFSVLLCLSTDANCRVNVLGVCSVSSTLGQHHRRQSAPLKTSAHQGIVLELFHIHSRHRKICSRSGYNHRRIRQTHNYSTLTWVLAQLIRRILLQQPLLQPPEHNPHLDVPRFNLDGYLSVPVRSVGSVSRRERANESALRDTIHRSTGLCLCVRPTLGSTASLPQLLGSILVRVWALLAPRTPDGESTSTELAPHWAPGKVFSLQRVYTPTTAFWTQYTTQARSGSSVGSGTHNIQEVYPLGCMHAWHPIYRLYGSPNLW